MLARQIFERWLPELHQYFCSRNWQALSRTNQKWHSRPPPGLNLETHGRERFGLGIPRDSLLPGVALELPANQMLRVEWRNWSQHFASLIANGITLQPSRRPHGQQRH